MNDPRAKYKGRKTSYSFVMLRHDVMRHENFKTLSGNATKLLIDLLSQFNGKNNGDFCATWSLMKKRGWRSKGTLSRALKELLQRGWIIKTRQGWQNHSGLYAVTWLPIDECDGKLDIAHTVTAFNTWKEIEKNRIAAPYEGQFDPVVVPIQKNIEAQTA